MYTYVLYVLYVCKGALWVSLHKILFLLQSFIVGVIYPFIASPPTCKAYPIAILMHDHCAIYALPPTHRLYGIHHTILVMAVSVVH